MLIQGAYESILDNCPSKRPGESNTFYLNIFFKICIVILWKIKFNFKSSSMTSLSFSVWQPYQPRLKLYSSSNDVLCLFYYLKKKYSYYVENYGKF